jgi:hypothetical protein
MSPDDLLPAFRDNVLAFISAMKRGGANVSVAATWRPPERAYLMHWCCMLADSGQDPAAIPPMKGVNIDWTCGGSVSIARKNAAAMKRGYGIEFPAALVSRHTQRRAIDMTIRWKNALSVRDFDGRLWRINSAPRSGSNSDLIKVGATFGVVKLTSDPPHWSEDGH